VLPSMSAFVDNSDRKLWVGENCVCYEKQKEPSKNKKS